MKRLTVLVLVLSIIGAIPVRAQDDGNRVQWTPYNFSIMLPEGWTTSQTAEYMILGTPDDVSAMNNGETPTGTVLMVEIIEPITSEDEASLVVQGPVRTTAEERRFGDLTLLTTEVSSTAGRQGMIMAVADTYRVTVSGPVDQWVDQMPMIETLIASIQAEPTQRAPAERLTMTVQWHDVRLRVPDNFETRNYGLQMDAIGLSSFENFRHFATTFSYRTLMVEIRDFSPIRHLFTLESLLSSAQTLMYQGRAMRLGEITLFEIGGFEAASVNFEYLDSSKMGQALALRTLDSLYLFVGIAESEQWEPTERNLFEAILATLERGE